MFTSLVPVLARTRTRQSFDANARWSRVFFLNGALNAVLHLSQLSDQLDVGHVTLESSKRVNLALTWVATINIMSCIQTCFAQSEIAA
jgi:hypothetical protein